MKGIQNPEIKEFEGIYREQMPLLIQEGLVPATIADIMKLRLEGKLSFDRYHDSVSGVAYAGNKKDEFKIIANSENLARVNPETKLYLEGIELTPEEYDSIKAKEFTRKDMIINKKLTQKEASKHLGWLEFVKDKELLEKYTEEFFRQVYDRYELKEAMGFYIGSLQEIPSLSAWRLEEPILKSIGDCIISRYFECLVGVSKELKRVYKNK